MPLDTERTSTEQRYTLGRRRLLHGAALLGSSGLLSACAATSTRPSLPPIRASTDRIYDMAVCLRPFRAAGPRLDTERVGNSLVVHNYGHGGSGWSLSWGSSAMAVAKAMEAHPQEIAVIGCGALGLTSAILAQRAGAKVTIYAREQVPDTRSFRASGAWTPDSRIALGSAAGPGFAAVWEQMARTSFKTHRQYLGLPGTPVEWTDYYSVRADEPPVAKPAHTEPELDFASYSRSIADLTPRARKLAPQDMPWRAKTIYRTEIMVFNIADYGHTLLNDFFIAGGQFRHADFHSPAEISALGKRVVINCTGYGARALWKDDSVVPVRGQIARLIPQPEVHYGLDYRHVYVVPRRDGIIVQDVSGGDMKGYGIDTEIVDRAESEHAVTTLAELFDQRLTS
ncbi:MAG: FAD-binding oxidoreductase [Proteobacteria bacterium]|nr:FAD-binding oxidoreductase [Pseudomonadota bacterium]